MLISDVRDRKFYRLPTEKEDIGLLPSPAHLYQFSVFRMYSNADTTKDQILKLHVLNVNYGLPSTKEK